ncbi:MAG: HAMP domain-containing histidine kinase [Clostridia bacterium]|nr:HAMP domain-containing histidine kinase [Clostridia bacterium]
MKSLYRRQFVIMAGVILISFALLGGAFITLSYQYTVGEKRSSIERNTEYMADFTAKALATGAAITIQDAFQSYVDTIAMVSDSYLILTTTDGRVIYASNGSIRTDLGGSSLPEGVVQEITATGSFSAMSDLGGIFTEKQFVAGRPIVMSYLNSQRMMGMVFMAAESSSITEMWRAFASIFFFTAVVVMFVAFITSSVTSLRQTKPLKEMAEATRRFGHGEFDVRVNCGPRCDEVGELADAFNGMADSLAKSEARRSEFVANISHELKTPMTTIAGFADGILDGTIPPEKQEESLKVISAETRRLSRLVRKMLDLSRLQSAEHVTAQEQFDVGEILLRVLVSLEGKINARKLDVDTHIPETPVLVWGDPDAITQVCYNLLDNAIKFSAEGGVLGITITAKGGKAHVAIKNQGETISPAELPMIFDRFHKTDRSRSEDREGVGLGLYIVKTILNNHKENISATSENGVTEFTFTLTQA